ncbi:mitochondrial substrate carrier family protein S-like [Babylonia areolata]|uniref:mitochondrial substrate carrier family protein S-like n=1 Tax=Babylonia areolata TaxID=304850 RepID=UPI003FD3324C
MTHNEERAHWIREGAIGLGVGVLYGVTNVVVGHPFDTLKTKMQGQAGFESSGMVQTFWKTLQTQGFRGLYRYAAVPPLWGSGIYRSIQFAAFEAVYTHQKDGFGMNEIPFTGGLQLRVLMGAACSATCRAIVETPLDYVKVRGQTNQKWKLTKVYTGFGITWVRTMGLMSTFFITVDSGRRHFPEWFKRPLLGPLFTAGIAATLAWWVVWPLEYMKCQIQCSYGQDMSVLQRMKLVIRERGGFLGLYRGLMPGTLRSFFANGASMIVMSFAHRKVSELGLRGS